MGMYTNWCITAVDFFFSNAHDDAMNTILKANLWTTTPMDCNELLNPYVRSAFLCILKAVVVDMAVERCLEDDG